MQLQSIRFKASVLYTVTLAVILGIYSAGLFFSVRTILYRDLDDKLKIKANEIAQFIYAYEQLEHNENHPLFMLERLLGNSDTTQMHKMIIDDLWRSDVETLNLKNDYIHILSTNGQVLLNSANFTDKMFNLFVKQFSRSDKKIFWGTLIDQDHRYRVINYPFKFRQRLPLIVQVATPLDPGLMILKKLLFYIVLSIAFILALTSFLGSFFVSRILKPVMTVIHTANQISSKDLSTRIEQQELDVEMQSLIESFNTMIGRLEQSFGHISEFSSHVAHELKTPLAIVRGELELALEQDPSRTDQRKTLRNCLEEIDRMIRIIRDLLLIAKLDYKPQIFKFEKIFLKEFFADIHEQGEILASEKSIEVRYRPLPEDLVIHADKVHLRRLFFNIISNAIKFTPRGGRIDLNVWFDADHVYTAVSDTGIGIAPEHLPKIFDKFYHVAKDDSGSDTGSGLGLSMALSIAKAHGGRIEVQSRIQEGTTFTVILPRPVS